MFRREVLTKVNGFDDSLIAGEDRDLCFRVSRCTGLALLCLDEPMVLHDMDMMRFTQYSRCCKRTGHSYAEIVHRQGKTIGQFSQPTQKIRIHGNTSPGCTGRLHDHFCDFLIGFQCCLHEG